MISNEINEEIWKPIPNFEKIYEVSSLGRIRRLPSKRIRSIDYATHYPSILLSENGIHHTYRVHRLVALAFLPKIKGKNHVNHKDGNIKNNQVNNLEWVTQQENNQHQKQIGHFKCIIPKQQTRKINDETIHLSFQEWQTTKLSTEILGPKYGVNGSTLRKYFRKIKKGIL